jgi:hypothetical protein
MVVGNRFESVQDAIGIAGTRQEKDAGKKEVSQWRVLLPVNLADLPRNTPWQNVKTVEAI